jgi:excisionase family DNA binding protein
MAPLSTAEVAKIVGIHRVTLEEWIARGAIPSPKKLSVGKHIVRLWSSKDVERLLKYRSANYNRKPHRKKAGRSKTRRSKS